MSSTVKACGPGPVVHSWIKVPDVSSPCVQDVAKGAVQEFNKKYEDSLKFDIIYEGWFCELGPGVVNYKLHIKALDFLGRLLYYELIVHEEKTPKEKIRKLVDLIIIATPEHYVGPVSPPKEDKWIKIPNLLSPFVQIVAKFSVDEFNKKTGDTLKYENTYDGWYAEIGQDNMKFNLHLKAKDCLGRVHSYHAFVLVQHSLTQKIKTLLSFKILENWIKIPDVKQHCVQVVSKFSVDEFNKKNGISLKFDSIYEGWYVELGPNNLKYRLLIKAIDLLGRLLNYEAIVIEEKPHGEKIRKLVTFIVIATPGHYVGPVKPPAEKKWIKISNLEVTFVIEVAKFALEEIKDKVGDNLKYDIISEGWYCEMGGDNIEFRLCIKAKDCLGRVHIYEAIVRINDFCTKKVKVLISFKCI